MVNLEIAGVAAVVVVDDESLLIQVADAEEQLGLFVDHRVYRGIVVLGECCPVEHFLPVVVFVSRGIEGNVRVAVAVKVLTVTGPAVILAAEAVVNVFLCAEHLYVLRHVGYSEICRKVNHSPVSAFSAALGGDDDDSVGASGTVNCRCSGILEHFY